MVTRLMLVLGLCVSMSGCSVFTYDLTRALPQEPVRVASLTGTPQPVTILTGQDCGFQIFGFGFGHLSVQDAMDDAGITALTKLEVSQDYLFLGGANCVWVEGTGPGITRSWYDPRGW